MTCASCANRIERKLNKLDGVTATVNYATEKAKVDLRRRRRPPTTWSRPSSRPGTAQRCPAPARTTAPRRRAGRRPGRRRCAQRLLVSTGAHRAGGRAGDGAGAAVHLLAVALADPGRAGRGVGSAGRSTGRPGRTCGTAPPRWTRSISLGTLAAFGWSLYALFFGTRGRAGHDAPVRADRRAVRRRGQHLPRGRRRGDHVHPGRALLRGPRPSGGPAPRCGRCWSWAPRTSPSLRDGVEDADPGRPARRRRPVRGPAGREDRHRRRRRGGRLRGRRLDAHRRVGAGRGRRRRRRRRARPSTPAAGSSSGPPGSAPTPSWPRWPGWSRTPRTARPTVQRLADRISGVFVPVVIALAVGHPRLLARHRRRARRRRSPPRSPC